MEKLLTVVMPVWNGERTLRSLLESLVAGADDFDVIAVDDGSTDGTRRVLAEHRVTTIRLEKNGGIAKARNCGIDAVRTRYVAFVDADCVVEKDWAAKMVREFETLKQVYPRAAAMSGKVLPFRPQFIDRLAAYVEHWEYQHGERAEERMKLSTANCICDTQILREVGKFDESLTVDEDRELGLRMVSRGFQVLYSPSVSVWHRHNRKSLSDILSHQFFWGEKTGLTNEWRYRELRKLWFLRWIRHPALYAAVVAPLAVILTWRVVKRLLKHDWGVIPAIPFILAAKMSYRLGVLKCLLNNKIELTKA
jgi:GT2 family glycosyltransferase